MFTEERAFNAIDLSCSQKRSIHLISSQRVSVDSCSTSRSSIHKSLEEERGRTFITVFEFSCSGLYRWISSRHKVFYHEIHKRRKLESVVT